jgi:gliding motility-associated-like protein
MKPVVVFLLLMINITIQSQNITVDDQRTAQDLIENILFNQTGCATVSNFSITGGNFGTNENSYAYFNGNGSSFPFAEGIVLSTGKASNTVGPNNNLSDDDGINWLTDADLETVLNTSSTLNATILEFDFIPQTNFISFEYIFASEEYQQGNANTCQFSDVFAFLIKPNGGQYVNIAVVPNTTTPVEVTTVHPDIPNGCPAINEAYFGSWNNNTAPINFNGQTTVLTAQSNVIINQMYHIKLVIADHINFRYDSAVFLKAGSFNVGTDLGVDRLRVTRNTLCGNETLALDAGIANSYQWYKDNVPLVGETLQNYTVISEGIYKVETDYGNGCLSESDIIVEYDTFPILSNTSLTACIDDNSQITDFDLTDANPIITNANNSFVVENFYESNVNAINDNFPILNPTSYTNLAHGQTVFARVRNTSGCVSIAEIILNVFQNPEVIPNQTQYYCLNTFPTTITLFGGIFNDNPNNYSYNWSNGATTQNIEINQEGLYTVDITNSDNCTVTREITVINSNIASIQNVLISNTLTPTRYNISIVVTGESDYEFAVDEEIYQDSNVFENILFGVHTVYVRDKNGCDTLEEEILILEFPKFVTPNDDGYYDTWNINNINAILTRFNTISDITIFDRFGKIMAIINPNGAGWDGKINGKLAEPNDYWFMVNLTDANGKIFNKRGHFSLTR